MTKIHCQKKWSVLLVDAILAIVFHQCILRHLYLFTKLSTCLASYAKDVKSLRLIRPVHIEFQSNSLSMYFWIVRMSGLRQTTTVHNAMGILMDNNSTQRTGGIAMDNTYLFSAYQNRPPNYYSALLALVLCYLSIKRKCSHLRRIIPSVFGFDLLQPCLTKYFYFTGEALHYRQ